MAFGCIVKLRKELIYKFANDFFQGRILLEQMLLMWSVNIQRVRPPNIEKE